MPYNGSGVFQPLSPPFYPAIPDTTIRSVDYNSVVQDILNGLTNAITRDGQSVPTANLPMGGKKHTGCAVAVAADEYATLAQVQALASAGFSVVVGDGITDNSAAVATAQAAGKPIAFVGISVIGTPITLTVPILDTLSQIFKVGSQITLNNNQFVRPDWWGDVQNSINYAVAALPASGGVVRLTNKVYKPNNHRYGFGIPANDVYFSKDNVSFIGEKMPRLADDCRSLTGGTIIQGMIIGYANNIEFRDLGVDSGKTVMDTYFGGAPSPGISGEGLLLTYPDDVQKAAAALRKNARLHNVIGLCINPSAAVHSVIVGEGYSNVMCTGEIVGCYGIHGVVVKCSNLRAEQFTSWCNGSEGVIIKSDLQSTAQATDIQIGKIFVDANGPKGWSPYVVSTTGYGVQFNPAGQAIDRVQIGQIDAYGYPIGVGVAGSYDLSDVQIGSLRTDGSGVVGGTNIGLSLAPGGTLRVDRFQVGNVMLRNHAKGVQHNCYGGSQTMLGNVEAVNITDVAVDISNQSYLSIDSLRAQNCTIGIFRITGTPKLLLGRLWRDFAGGGCPTYTTNGGGLAPALTNSWTQVASNDIFNVDLSGGRINLKGLVKPGSSNVLTTLPQWAWPSETKRLLAQGYNGSATVAVPVTVSTNGNVTVNEVAGGTANCSTWLSLTGVSYDAQFGN